MNIKRILALSGAALLVMLYLSTLIFALLDHPASQNFLAAALFCTIVIPAVLYGYLIVIRHLKKRDFNEKLQQKEDEEKLHDICD